MEKRCKLYVVQKVVGGVAADPAIFSDRKAAIMRYIEWLTNWNEVECGKRHKQPLPTEENFDTYWDRWEVVCDQCDPSDASTWFPSEVGHDDDDLNFYDGIELED